jgi:hypothetical protein
LPFCERWLDELVCDVLAAKEICTQLKVITNGRYQQSHKVKLLRFTLEKSQFVQNSLASGERLPLKTIAILALIGVPDQNGRDEGCYACDQCQEEGEAGQGQQLRIEEVGQQ